MAPFALHGARVFVNLAIVLVVLFLQGCAGHVMDAFDHDKFRAAQAERSKKKTPKLWSGFLQTDDGWQDDYLSGKKGADSRYFARGPVG